MKYLPIEKDKIPYGYEIQLDQVTYTIRFDYNPGFDFFTVEISQGETVLTSGEKLLYGKRILSSYDYIDFPPIVPLDLNGVENRITWENLMTTVFLWVGGVE